MSTPHPRPRDTRTASPTLTSLGLGGIAAALLLGAVVMLGTSAPADFDAWWHDAIVEHRTDELVAAATVLDHVGGGWLAVLVVPLAIVVALVATGRWRGATFAAVAFALSAGVVQLLKLLYGRARPEDMLVTSDVGSFPSGHTANAATIAVVLVLLLPRAWVAIVGAAWVVAMAASRMVLSVHWLSDVVAGVFVGASVAALLAAWALPWARTRSVRPQPRRAAAVAVAHDDGRVDA